MSKVLIYSQEDLDLILELEKQKNEELQQENQQLKIQISAKEKEYKKLEETNKVLSQELTKDNLIKQDHLTTCCGIPIADIPKLQQEIQQLKINCNIGNENLNFYREEYKKLEDNWNKLKDFLENNWKETQDIWFVKIINKMRDIERGVSDER